MTTDERPTVLITGATGAIGSAVISALRAAPVRVRALVRDRARAEAAGLTTGPGAPDLIVGDPLRPGLLDRALDGADTVFVCCGNVAGQVAFETSVIDAAAAAGVGRVVKLSAQGARLGSPVAFWDWHARIEQRLLDSGIPSVVLRPSFLMSNLFASADTVRAADAVFAPAGRALITMVDPADVAACAAAVIVDPSVHGRVFTLTGPAAVDFDRVAAALTATLGRTVDYRSIPDRAAVDAMTGAGLPTFVAQQIVAVFAAQCAGAQQVTTTAVRMLTGREPNPLESFVAAHRTVFGATADITDAADPADTVPVRRVG